MKTTTVKYEIVDDNVLEEIALNAINAKDNENFMGYAGSVSQFHHYVASIATELQQFRSETRNLTSDSVSRTITEDMT